MSKTSQISAVDSPLGALFASSDEDDFYPREYTCPHLKTHRILIRDATDHLFLAFFIRDGWVGGGWCPAYMPEWLKPRYWGNDPPPLLGENGDDL